MHPVEALLVPVGWALRKRRPDPATSIANAPELQTGTRLSLTSPGFRDGDVIPAKYCGVFIGPETSPALAWSALPAGTERLVLVFEDLDNPLSGVPGIHTVAAFAPMDGGLPEGALTRDNPAIQFLANHRGRGTYVGPRPFPGHGPHHYRFHLYAVDSQVDLTQVADAAHLPAALAGHVLAAGTLNGTRTT